MGNVTSEPCKSCDHVHRRLDDCGYEIGTRPYDNMTVWCDCARPALVMLVAFVGKVAGLTLLSKLNLTDDAIKLSDEAKTLWLSMRD